MQTEKGKKNRLKETKKNISCKWNELKTDIAINIREIKGIK